MNRQAKVELLLELNNKLKTGLYQAKKDTFKGVNDIQTKLNSVKYSLAKNSKAIIDEVPMLGNAFRLAQNPIALTAAGIVAIGKGIDYTTQKAADFNTQFRQLSNLNLDKSRKEINSLKRMVMDTAFDKGFDSEKTIMGYFDVQSTTGKYGSEVKKIVEKQGEFANLMQADFNNYIAGTAKGMANFGFKSDKLEEFNRSAYATVKVGVTTFDQLAQVQSVYAGAAASNNQTFDTANKLLALFTVKTKSVDEAATLTKSMFNDLTKDATIKAFKKVGINLYDNNGKIKQADTLMLELNKKFKGLDSDKKVMALKNQFSGSEGIIAMIQAATDKSGQLQATFDNFDTTKLDMDKAINLAKNDLNYKTEILRNKLNIAEIEIGTALLPLKAKIAELKLAAVDLVNALYFGKNKDRNQGATWANSKYMDLIDKAPYMSKEEFVSSLTNLKVDINKTEHAWKKTGGFSEKLLNAAALAVSGQFKTAFQYMKLPSGDTFGSELAQLKEIEKLFISTWRKATSNGKNLQNQSTTNTNQTNKSETSSLLSDGVDTITGSAKQVRNLTVNIEAFNKGGINTQNTSLQRMDGTQIEEWFTEMCMRVVRSIETSY